MSLNLSKNVLHSVAVLAAVAVPLVVGQTQTLPEFEVASVKPMAAGDRFGPRFGCMPNGTFVSHQPLRQVLLLAFDIRPFQLVSVPDWDPVVMYDSKGLYAIEAKASGPVTEAQCKLMVQSLLADRYKMVAHREQREIPVYALVVGKNGPKLKKALDTDTTGNNIIVNGNPMGIAAGRPADSKDPGWSMANLADFLRIAVDRPVVDRTGVDGNYRINLNFSRSNLATAAEPPAGAGPDIRTALQEQLGLRLEATNAPVEMVIIDHIEKPTDN